MELQLWYIHPPEFEWNEEDVCWRWVLKGTFYCIYGNEYKTKYSCKRAALNVAKKLGITIKEIYEDTRTNYEFLA